MMRHLAKVVLAPAFALLVGAGSSGFGQTNQSFPELDRYVQTSMQSWQVPGVAIAIVRGSEPVYLKGYGVRSLETRQPVTPDTLFDIGSCTKAFTSASIAILADEGNVNCDDNV